MTALRPLDVAAGAVYLGLTAAVTYGVWAPVDDSDPTARFFSVVFAGLLVLHVALGAGVGRWWCLALPLGWTALSMPAGGYDAPLFVGILFQSVYFWIPALIASVGLRRLIPDVVRPRRRGTPRDILNIALCVVFSYVLLALPVWVLYPGS